MVRGALLSLALLGCYDLPRPECGFRCGPNEACPEDYTCNRSDGRCHLNGSSPSLVCGTVDAAFLDGPPDPLDVPPDVPADAAVDAAVDAAADAPVADATAL